MAVCPRCGSHNYRYELRSAGTRSTTNYYRTGIKSSWIVPAGKRRYQSNRQQKSVGFCPDCGYVDQAQEKGCLWYLLLLMFWPIALSVWFYRTPLINLERKWRALILTGVWAVLLLIGYFAPSSETDGENNTVSRSVWNSEITPLDDFEYFIDGDEVTLTEYIGNSERINIASEYDIDGKPFRVISLDGTFALRSVTSVVVPDGVISIANNTFNSCGIKYLYLPATLEQFGGWSYFHDMQKIYYGGSEEQWSDICTIDRSMIEVVQIIFDADLNDILASKE